MSPTFRRLPNNGWNAQARTGDHSLTGRRFTTKLQSIILGDPTGNWTPILSVTRMCTNHCATESFWCDIKVLPLGIRLHKTTFYYWTNTTIWRKTKVSIPKPFGSNCFQDSVRGRAKQFSLWYTPTDSNCHCMRSKRISSAVGIEVQSGGSCENRTHVFYFSFKGLNRI